jgi:hypothetical protein
VYVQRVGGDSPTAGLVGARHETQGATHPGHADEARPAAPAGQLV